MSWILRLAGFFLYGCAGASLATAGVTVGDWQFWATVGGCIIGSTLIHLSDDLK